MSTLRTRALAKGGGWARVWQWMLENDVDAAELDTCFCIDVEEFDIVTQIELKEVLCLS